MSTLHTSPVSLSSLITGVLGVGVAGAVKDIGYFDASNGVIYRQNGASGLQFIRRTNTSGSVVDNVVDQTNWNLDRMDGTGPSGIVLDATKVFILVIDLQFLGTGRIRVGFDVNGVIIYAHEFRNANFITVPHMQTASLPVQALLTATGTAETASMHFKCAAVISEGGFQSEGLKFSTANVSITAGSGARTHALSLRPLTTFNSLTNRTKMLVTEINVCVTGAFSVYWELVVGAAFSPAPTWADVNSTYSSTEAATGGTFSALTSGIVIQSGYVPASGTSRGDLSRQVNQRYPITLDRAGAVRALGTITLLMTGLGGAPAARASLGFEELR